MSNINYGPNSSRFINGAANITTKAMLYPVGFKHVSGTQRVGTWRCPVRGCTKVNYDYKKRKGAP